MALALLLFVVFACAVRRAVMTLTAISAGFTDNAQGARDAWSSAGQTLSRIPFVGDDLQRSLQGLSDATLGSAVQTGQSITEAVTTAADVLAFVTFAAPAAETARIRPPKGYEWTERAARDMRSEWLEFPVPDTTLTLDVRTLPVLRGRVVREEDGSAVEGRVIDGIPDVPGRALFDFEIGKIPVQIDGSNHIRPDAGFFTDQANNRPGIDLIQPADIDQEPLGLFRHPSI